MPVVPVNHWTQSVGALKSKNINSDPWHLLSLVCSIAGDLSEQNVEYLGCSQAPAPVGVGQSDCVSGTSSKLSIH